jgi:hypothetical protein
MTLREMLDLANQGRVAEMDRLMGTAQEATESARLIYAQADRIIALEAELASLRDRIAERDASVAWAIKRGAR